MKEIKETAIDSALQSETSELLKVKGYVSLLKYALPAIFAYVFTAFYQIVDSIFIERYAGESALGVINLFYPVISLFIAAGIMLGTGGNAVVVKRKGSGDNDGADKAISSVITAAIAIGFLFTLICLCFPDTIMKCCGATETSIIFLRPYYQVLCAAATVIILQTSFSFFLVGEGASQIAAILILTGGILNCLLDYLFMSWFSWGIFGAAFATALGYLIPVLYAFDYYLIRKKSIYNVSLGRIDLKDTGTALFNGSSEMISNLAGGITALIMNHLIYHFHGDAGIIALSVVLYMQFFALAVFMGFTSVVEPLFSFYYGSGDTFMKQKIYRLSRNCLAVGSIVLSGILFLLRRNIIEIYFTPGTEIWEISLTGLSITIAGCPFACFNIFISGIFTAFSDGKISSILSFVRTLLILIICLLGLSTLWEEIGMWLAWPVTEIISLFISVYLLWKYRKKYEYMPC